MMNIAITIVFIFILFSPHNGSANKIEIELIKDCIKQFIIQNSNNELLAEFNLSVSSIEGLYRKQEEGVYFVGNWVVKNSLSKPTACYFTHYSKAISSKLTIQLKRKKNGYEILKFEIQHIYRTFENQRKDLPDS